MYYILEILALTLVVVAGSGQKNETERVRVLKIVTTGSDRNQKSEITGSDRNLRQKSIGSDQYIQSMLGTKIIVKPG